MKKFKFEITDTLDYKSGEDAYAMIININYQNQILSYDLIGEDISSSTNDLETRIKLTGANNLTNNKGGYGVHAEGMQELLSEFHQLVLYPLAKHENIKVNVFND
jgi:hypothetical protein